MGEANIPDINYRDVQEQLQEKFGLKHSEEEATKEFELLLNSSSPYHNLLDKFHNIVQYWRS